MLETSARLLRMLSLLQARPYWSGAELARRLDVTTRTIRNDIDRLRGLGYPVEARPGVDGGYRLGAGSALPPLLLDDTEAVAVVVGLRTVATTAIAGVEEASLRALGKLEQILPSRLRHRVKGIGSHTLRTPTRGPLVDPETLTALASCCRDADRLRFDYRANDGAQTRRSVEPYRLISHRQRWYLFAWDLDRDDWRTFRVDRITPAIPTGPRFAPRELPPDDQITARLIKAIGESTWRYRARIIVHAPADYVRGRLPIPVDVEELGADRCAFRPGSDHPEMLALYLGLLGADFDVDEGPELVQALDVLADRYRRAIASHRRP
ncbi:MAG: YafY family transcriptional regulator [Mycobacteriaceae bacterium]|nr:YafY family transcriptional regulator [Mycobacteriaceae bacterium]